MLSLDLFGAAICFPLSASLSTSVSKTSSAQSPEICGYQETVSFILDDKS